MVERAQHTLCERPRQGRVEMEELLGNDWCCPIRTEFSSKRGQPALKFHFLRIGGAEDEWAASRISTHMYFATAAAARSKGGTRGC